MSAPPTPREVVAYAFCGCGDDEPTLDNAAAILAALAAAPTATRLALARAMLAGTEYAVVPVEPTDVGMRPCECFPALMCRNTGCEHDRAMLAAAAARTEGESDE